MFIKPKKQFKYDLNAKVSKDAHITIQEYAYYTGYDVDTLLNKLILHLLDDKNFIKSVKNKRDNKKIMGVLKDHDIIQDSDLKEVDEKTPFDKKEYNNEN